MGPFEDRMLLTGLHTICDLYCKNCNAILGWKYVSLIFKKGKSLRRITEVQRRKIHTRKGITKERILESLKLITNNLKL